MRPRHNQKGDHTIQPGRRLRDLYVLDVIAEGLRLRRIQTVLGVELRDEVSQGEKDFLLRVEEALSTFPPEVREQLEAEKQTYEINNVNSFSFDRDESQFAIHAINAYANIEYARDGGRLSDEASFVAVASLTIFDYHAS